MCNVKTLLKVLSQINSAPQNQNNIKGPNKGTAAKIFENTVKPQYDICEHGKTYPKKAIITVNTYKIIPIT